MIKRIFLVFVLVFIFFSPIKVDAQTARSLNNIVVFVEFADDACDYYSSNFRAAIEHSYNACGKFDVSAKKYFKEVSSNKLHFNGIFANYLSGKKAVRLKNDKGYYMPKTFSDGTPTLEPQAYDNGYYIDGKPTSAQTNGAKRHIDGALREYLMVCEILSKITVDSAYNYDTDNDGNVDNITFILSGNVFFASNKNVWGELLWPHMTSLANFDRQSFLDNYYVPTNFYENYMQELQKTAKNTQILQKNICNYNILSAEFLFTSCASAPFTLGESANVGVICHEVMHVLGVMDYYSYQPQKKPYLPVGKFDIMASTAKNPQYPLTYIRQKLGWVEPSAILHATKSGKYTLHAVSANAKIKAIKIKPAHIDTQEFFMVEVRSNKYGVFDKVINASGIIIYRIDPYASIQNGNSGNMYGNDEIFVFRKYCHITNAYDKTPDSGLLVNGQSYGSFFDSFNTLYYQGSQNPNLKGANSNIVINNIKSGANGSISFNITFK